jgi:vitamin B12 transporter
LFGACWCAPASADDLFGASADVRRPLAASNREDATASGTEIEARERQAAHETVSDLLLEIPGSRSFRTGALGSFTSASLRGAEVEHTVVLFGELPISSADAGAFNLSTIPVSALDKLVVYRGGAPVWLSQGAIGGVIQLVPRSATGTALSSTATAGSLGTYGLSLESAVVPSSDRLPSLLATVSVLGSNGDFQFPYDNKTSLDPSDDYIARRKNADFLDASALLHLTQPAGRGAFDLVMLGFERVAGEPAAPADPAFKARHNVARGVFALGYTVDRNDAAGERVLRLQAQAGVTFERSRFTDLFGEITPSEFKLTDDASMRSHGRLAGTVAASDFLDLTLVGTAEHEAFDPSNPLARPPMPGSGRSNFASAAEPRLHGTVAGHRVELRPSLRLEHSTAQLHSERFGEVVASRTARTFPTYRLAFALGLLPDLTLSASLASGTRAPSMLELFGNGALILGNTALLPERSHSYDVGLVDIARLGHFESNLELRGFKLDVQDQIVFVRNSFTQIYPRNLDDSHMRGIEASARISFARRVWLNSAATLLHSEGKIGKRLPNRPGTVWFIQPGVTVPRLGPFDALQAFIEGSYVSPSYDDPDNQTPPKPSQWLFDAGAVLLFMRSRAQLRVTVNDLFDRGGQDLRHFPLPGRTVMTSLTIREGT